MLRPGVTELVGRVTGPGSPDRTDERFGIHGTDLGIMWDDGAGRTLVVFGDTYGRGWGGHGAGPPTSPDWRCNALAVATGRDLDRGLRLDSVVAGDDGHARQILDRDGGREETVIPTSGIAVDGKQYLHYMSVRKWGGQGEWTTNYAGVAVSGDGGATWDKPVSARWPNRWRRDHPFQMGAFARDGDHVHLLGTPNGRWGAASLARVSTVDILDPAAYEYWDGGRWRRDEPFRAKPVLSGPVAELSVLYNVHFGLWVALHLDEARAAIVLRTAERLTGPWADGRVVASGSDFPGLYGGFLHPVSAEGPTLYYALSQWAPYNVFLLRTPLTAG